MELSLAEALGRDPGELRAGWRRRFLDSPLKLAAGGEEELFALGEPVSLLLGELGRGRGDGAGRDLVPGSTELREVEKAVAFAGAAAVGTASTGYDVAAVFLTLRDELASSAGADARAEIAQLFEWLLIVALEAYASAAERRAAERSEGELERGTPVVLLPGEVPAAFLVGSPQALTLEAVFGRLVLLVARVGTPAVVIDGTGLVDPDAPAVREAVSQLCRHEELRARATLFASGLSAVAAESWRQIAASAGARLEVFERTADAVAQAMDASRHRSNP